MDAQVIIILLAIAFSIISALGKNKKKKNTPAQNQPPADNEDPWATIRKYIEDAQMDDDDFHEPHHGKRIEPAAINTHPEKERKIPDEIGEDPYVSSLNKYMAQKEKETDKKQNIKKKNKLHKDVLPTQVIKGKDKFDLRKAVIYSEILKPKFEEL